MKILATSDLHGHLPKIKEEFDLLFICGDICPAYNHNVHFQFDWCTTELVNWLNSLPYKDANSKVVLIWGNHDFWGETNSYAQWGIEEKTNGRVKVLTHDVYEHEFPVSDGLDSFKIFGTPYCSVFGGWAFMLGDEDLDKKYSQIPDDIDILLSHDSPNIYKLGAITEGLWKSDTTGNRVLPNHIDRIKPKMFFSGHFHSGNHNFEEHYGTWTANVSLVNEQYEPVNPILMVNYDEENRKIISHDYLKIEE